MKSFGAFFKKELTESARNGKTLIVLTLFAAVGITNPAIAKLTPWMMDVFSDSFSDIGIIVGNVEVNALTSWTQFFKNIPIALIAFVLIYSGIFTKEYESGTLILVITKGIARYKILVSKLAYLTLSWTAGFWSCFLITYGYNAYFWDNSIAKGLIEASVCWWLFGLFVICAVVFFSVIVNSGSGVLLGAGGSVLLSYLLGLLPKAYEYTPTSLMDVSLRIAATIDVEVFIKAIIVTSSLSVISIATGIFLFNKKQL